MSLESIIFKQWIRIEKELIILIYTYINIKNIKRNPDKFRTRKASVGSRTLSGVIQARNEIMNEIRNEMKLTRKWN